MPVVKCCAVQPLRQAHSMVSLSSSASSGEHNSNKKLYPFLELDDQVPKKIHFIAYYHLLVIAFAVIFIVAIIRSSIVLHLHKVNAEDFDADFETLATLSSIEQLLEQTHREMNQRIGDILNNKQEMNNKRNLEVRQFFDRYLTSWNSLFKNYTIPEQLAPGCTITDGSRQQVIRLRTFRELPDGILTPINITEYFTCLVEFTLDVHQYLIVDAPSMNPFWREAVAYHLSLRTLSYFEMVQLLRQLVFGGNDTAPVENDYQSFYREAAQLYLSSAVELLSETSQFSSPVLDETLFYEPVANMMAQLNPKSSSLNVPNIDAKLMNALEYEVNFYFEKLKKQLDRAQADEKLSMGGEIAKLLVICCILLPGFIIHVSGAYRRKVNADMAFDEKVSEFEKTYEAVSIVVSKPLIGPPDVILPLHTEFYYRITVVNCEIVGLSQSLASKAMNAMEGLLVINQLSGMCENRCKEHGCHLFDNDGDAFIAAAGTPERVYNHATKACNLAASLIEGMTHFRLLNHKSIHLKIRIGIATGSAVIGLNCGLNSNPYTMYGNALSQSARMRSLSKPHCILINDMCYSEIVDDINAAISFNIRPNVSTYFTDDVSYWLDTQMATGKAQ